jgi:cell division protein FtsN
VARSAYRHSHNTACPPPWLWLLAGTLIGICFSVLAYVYGIIPPPKAAQQVVATVPTPPPSTPQTPEPQVTPTAKPPSVPPATETPLAPTLPQTRFEFYEILPNPAAPITSPLMRPEDFPVATEPFDNNDVAPVPTSGGHLMLQVASFRTQADAQKLRDQLSAWGFESSIQNVTINHQEWFRTRVGPFASELETLQAQARLQEYNLHAILVKY